METRDENETEHSSANDGRFPLAFDANGNPLDVPAEAVAWRVRRSNGRRGRPRNVFNDAGRQLDLPLGANADDLIEAGCRAGRYLLYPINAEGQIIGGIIAVTELIEEKDDEESASTPGADVIQQLLVTVRSQSETLCRALEATASGYGQVRPATPPPVVFEAPQPPVPHDDGNKEHVNKLMEFASQLFNAFLANATPKPPTAT